MKSALLSWQLSPVYSSAIPELGNTMLLSAVITAKERAIFLKTVANNSDPTCRTGRYERMNCALKTIVCMNLPVLGDLESLVVIVTAGFAFRHDITCSRDFRVI
jgi:hypothetical protein